MADFRKKESVTCSGSRSDYPVTLLEHINSENPHPNMSVSGGSGSGTGANAIADHNADPNAHRDTLARKVHDHNDKYYTKSQVNGLIQDAVNGITPGGSGEGSGTVINYNETETTVINSLDDEFINQNGFNALDEGKYFITVDLNYHPENVNCANEHGFLEVSEARDDSAQDGLGFYIVQKLYIRNSPDRMYIRTGKTTEESQVSKDEEDPDDKSKWEALAYTFGPWVAVGTGAGCGMIDYSKQPDWTEEKYFYGSVDQFNGSSVFNYTVRNTGFVHVVGSTQYTMSITVGNGMELPLTSGGYGQGTVVGTFVFYAEAGTQVVIKNYNGNWKMENLSLLQFQNYAFLGIYEYKSSIVGGSGSGTSGGGVANIDVRRVQHKTSLVTLTCNSSDSDDTNNIYYNDFVIMVDNTEFSVLSDSSRTEGNLPAPANVPLGAFVKYILFGGSNNQSVVITDGTENHAITVQASKNIMAEFILVKKGSGNKRWALMN